MNKDTMDRKAQELGCADFGSALADGWDSAEINSVELAEEE